MSFIYDSLHRQPLATYPLTSDGQPYVRQYTWSCNPWCEQTLHVAMQAVGSYPAFSPLPLRAVIFFFTYLPSRIASTLRNTVSYIARTFLFFCPERQNQRQTVALILRLRRYYFLISISKKSIYFLFYFLNSHYLLLYLHFICPKTIYLRYETA